MRDFQYGIVSLFCGTGLAGLINGLRRAGVLAIPEAWIVLIAWVVIGLSYLLIRSLRKAGRLQ